MKQLYTFIFLAVPFLLQAQGTWNQRASLPAAGRAGGVVFTIDGIAYVGGGWGASSFDVPTDLWAYNATTDSWSQKASLPVVRLNPICFAIGGKGYYGTGQNEGGAGYNADFWEYDPANDTWTPKASIPGGVRGGAFAFTIGNKGYVGGGINSTTGGGWPGLAMLQEYDPATDQWTEKAMYPGNYRNRSTAFTIEGMGYVAGGYSVGGGVYAQVYEYNAALDQWSQKQSLPSGRGNAEAFVLNGNAYLIGGNPVFPSPTYVADVLQYDPIADTWTMLAPFPGGIRADGMAFSLDGKGYHCAGRSGSGAAVHNDLWEFAPLGTGMETAWSDRISMFPNPSSGLITLGRIGSGTMSIAVYDLSGKLVHAGQEVNAGTTVDLHHLLPGAYVISVEQQGAIFRERLVIEQ